MTLLEAIKERHSVRKYIDKPIEDEKVAALQEAIARINEQTGLNIQLVVEEPRAFASGMWKYGQFSGVRNYLVMAGPKGTGAEEAVGYWGEELVLKAQTMGLSSCWVGLTYTKIPGTFTLRKGDVVHLVIALGYGTTPGVQHPGHQPAEIPFHAHGRADRPREGALFDGGLHANRPRNRQISLRARSREGEF